MSSYCLKCRKNTENLNLRTSKLGLKTPLNKIPLLGNILF